MADVDLDKLDFSGRNANTGGIEYEEFRKLPIDTQREIKRRYMEYGWEVDRQRKAAIKATFESLTGNQIIAVLALADRPLDTGQVLDAVFDSVGQRELVRHATNAPLITKLMALVEDGRVERGKGEGLSQRWDRKRVGFNINNYRAWFWWTPENAEVWDKRNAEEADAAEQRWGAFVVGRAKLLEEGAIANESEVFYASSATSKDQVSIPLNLFLRLVADHPW